MAIATVSSAIPPKMVRSMPHRDAHRGAIGATNPKTSTGSVVSNPVTVLLHPVEALIWPTSGATATTAGRKLAATSMMPTAAMTAAAPLTGLPGSSECSDAAWGRAGLRVTCEHRGTRCFRCLSHSSMQHYRRGRPATNSSVELLQAGRRCMEAPPRLVGGGLAHVSNAVGLAASTRCAPASAPSWCC